MSKEWDGTCSCTGCYWNMWNPNSKYTNSESSKVCVSESLDELKMTPNTTDCEGYYSFKEACGMTKEENKTV